MTRPKNIIKCFCCQSEFQFGFGAYQGTHVPGYEITVFRSCYDGNWDGWAPHHEGLILKHLRERDLEPPSRNSSGWLPRDWPVAGA